MITAGVVFALYLVLILGGVASCIVLGLLHR